MDYKEYLDAHGLNQEYVEKVWNWQGKEDRIVIPTYNGKGELDHVNYRMFSGANKFIRDQGAKPSLYGIHKAKDCKSVIYCEGQADCVKLWQEGIPAVTDTAGVGKIKDDWAAQLKDKNIYLCLDSDESGMKEVTKDYKILSKYAKEVKIISLPKEFKDICEFFKEGLDKEDFKLLITQAVASVDEWVLNNAPAEHSVESVASLLNAELPPEQWIIENIVPWSGFSVIAGEEATGKTFYAMSMAKCAVTGEAWLGQYNIEKTCKVLFLDKENERVIFQDRARGLNLDVCGDKLFRIVRPELFAFVDNKGDFTEFAKMLSAFVRVNDVQLIILDSLIDFIVGDENSGVDTQFFFSAVRELFPDRSILMLAHYGKPVKGQNRSPAQMIAGSRNIAAQITSGLAVKRSEYASNEFILQSIKNRNSVNNQEQFKVTLHSKEDPKRPGKTLVVGIEYGGVIEEETLNFTKAIEIITEKIREAGAMGISRSEAIEAAKDASIAERTAVRAIKQISVSGEFDYRLNGVGSQKSFYIKLPQNREYDE